MLCVIRWRGDQSRRYELIAGLGHGWMTDWQPNADTRADGTATPGKAEATDSKANGRRGTIKHVRPADDRETDSGITAAILTDQNSLGCGLKSTDGDVYCILAGIISCDGAVGGRELRPGASP